MSFRPSDSPAALARFLACLEDPEAGARGALDLVPDLVREGQAEEARRRLREARTLRRRAEWAPLREALDTAAAEARQRRSAGLHLDTERTRLRLLFARRSPLQSLNPSETLRALGAAFSRAGLPLALGLGKAPRPLVTLGPPLPVDTEGLGEWVDAVLAARPEGPPDAWLRRLNEASPEGLEWIGLQEIPAFASPLLELAREAHWAWDCPADLGARAREALEACLGSARFEIEKSGKSEGQKALKRVDIRPLLLGARWEGDRLHLSLRMEPGEALNPRKLLGGILGIDPSEILGLVRTRVVLGEDPRLEKAERFQTKLRNMYEDAVPLSGGPNLVLVDEDDEEPLRLG